MKHDQATPAGTGASEVAALLEGVATQRIRADNESRLSAELALGPDAHAGAGGASARNAAMVRAHTLLLAGKLDCSSTPSLEAAIEGLCEAGIRDITLDLRELSDIDGAGIAVIVFRDKWCRRRGCRLLLIGASRQVQCAFERAPTASGLTFLRDQADTPRACRLEGRAPAAS